MPMRRAESASDWVMLGEASRMLGIAPATLRRWSDAGRVRAFTTPGGHRRYRRSALERLIPADRIDRPSLVRSGMTTNRVARAYREAARVAARQLPWVVRLDDVQRGWFREHGRRLAEALLAYLDADEPTIAELRLAEATAQAAAYGRMTSGLELSLSQAVEGFLQFRRPFLHQLTLAARQRGFDTEMTIDLMEAAETAMDRLLVAVMAAHRVGRVGTGREGGRGRRQARIGTGPKAGHIA